MKKILIEWECKSCGTQKFSSEDVENFQGNVKLPDRCACGNKKNYSVIDIAIKEVEELKHKCPKCGYYFNI